MRAAGSNPGASGAFLPPLTCLSRDPQASGGLAEHREYLECKLSSLRKLTGHLDTVIAWVMEVKTRINISKELSEPDRSRVIEHIMVSGRGAMI